MGKKTKSNKVKKGMVKELFDLEIDEVSAVDKPAIGEEFYITKSVNKKNKGQAMGKKVSKSAAWKEGIKKSDSNGTHCVFCGITHEEEAEQMGMGLLKGVCFGCACEHADKEVFEQCVEGTFDVEAFAKSYPDVELVLEKEDSEAEGEEDESEEEGSEEENEDSEDDSEESDEEDEDAEGESSKSANDDVDGDEEAGSESNEGEDITKRLSSLEKNIEDVEGMLSRSLELHDMAAGALNEVVALTFASLDMLMQMASEKEEMKSETFDSLHASIKSVRSEISKANVSKKGAKISAKRMQVLRQIAEQLSSLIESVVGSEKGEGKEKSFNDEELQKSLGDFSEEIKNLLKEHKEDIDGKLEDLEETIKDIEQSGDGSHSIEDDEEDEDEEDEEESEEEKSKGSFAGILKLDEIKKDISGRQERAKKKRS